MEQTRLSGVRQTSSSLEYESESLGQMVVSVVFVVFMSSLLVCGIYLASALLYGFSTLVTS